MNTSEFWMLLAGLSLFLYGMFHLEDSMKQLEGRSFKLFLKKQTSHKFKAIFSGMLITAILQSSSIVNLTVLSFVGSGLISMRNALAVVLGANIGGTFNSWLVALLGFKLDINLVTLPIIGFSGIAMIAFQKRKTIYRFGKLGMGFGLLLFGLQLMKESMATFISQVDISTFIHYPRIVFVLIGFIITSLIQTSAATVVLVLSALYAKIIPIETAVLMVLGAELGTTIKVLLGAIGGIAAKKRVALGNFIFNFFTSLLGFIFLSQIIQFIHHFLGIYDPIILLVAFQTFINIGGVIAFYFFIGKFGNFLEKLFKGSNQKATSYLPLAGNELPIFSIELLEKEVLLFINNVINLNQEAFEISASHPDNYNKIKQAEGEVFKYYSLVIKQNNIDKHLPRINQLMEIIRNAMYAAKGIKDIIPDLQELKNSIIEIKFNQYEKIKKDINDFYETLKLILQNQDVNSNEINQVFLQIKHQFDQTINEFYHHSAKKEIIEKDISTLFNVNREIYASAKAITLAVANLKDNNKQPENQ
jgi:phosphate:Na+ symporter